MISSLPFNGLNRWLKRNTQLWLRLTIIAGVLLFSAGLAYLDVPLLVSLLVIALPFGIVWVLLFLRWPPLGLVITVFVSYAIPGSIGPINIVIVLLALLTGLWVLDMVARQRKIRLIPSPTITPLILFLAVAIIAFLAGQLPWYPLSPAPLSAQIGGMGIFLFSVCAYLLVAHQMRDYDLRWLKRMSFLFVAIGGVVIAYRLAPAPFKLPLAQGVFGSLFWTWLVTISFSQAVFNRRLAFHWRVLLAVVAGITMLSGLLHRDWSSGWVPAVASLAVIMWVGVPRIALPATLMGVLVLGGSLQDIFYGLLYTDNAYSTLTRLEAWRIVIEIVKVNPILGLGPANYYWYTPLYAILGWYTKFNSHNNYVDIIAQTGLLGMACFLWFVWEVGKLGWRLRTRVPEGGFAQAYVYGAIGGLVGTLVAGMLGDWVLPFVYNIGMAGFRGSMFGWLFLGGLLAIEQVMLARAVTNSEKAA